MRIDLTDTTFIIPVRVDSMVRLENLVMTVDHLRRHFRTSILILEAAAYANQFIPSLIQGEDVAYQFVEDKDPVFHKTKCLNILARQVTTPIVGIWDADVVVDHSQTLDAVTAIRSDRCDIAYPYDGDFLDTSDVLRAHYFVNRDLDFLRMRCDKMLSLYTVEGS